MKTGNDICAKALDIINSGRYVYWYGGKGEQCSQYLLKTLSSMYPNIYTASYIKKCKADILAGKRCIDCSGFVSMVYGFPGEGTYGIYNHAGITQCYTEPKNGMILWKSTHTGIYFDGKVLESRGQRYGLTCTRKYRRSDWTAILQLVDVDYGNKKNFDYENLAQDVIAGKYGNGAMRKKKLKAIGLTDAQISNVQKKVNEILKKGNYSNKTNFDCEKFAQEVIAGKYGNGVTRKKKLKAIGLTDTQISNVQKKVNEILKKGKR